MRFTTYIVIALFLPNISCAGLKNKKVPEYTGIDHKVKTLVDKFLSLSAEKDIVFENKVTIGFKKIDYKRVIGVCNYGSFFREIDLDISFWNRSTYISKQALLFHEMAHCYCGRDHDYEDGKQYPDDEANRLIISIRYAFMFKTSPGFYEDGCPLSIMYPVLVDDDCMTIHYNQYIEEMFQRCNPW